MFPLCYVNVPVLHVECVAALLSTLLMVECVCVAAVLSSALLCVASLCCSLLWCVVCAHALLRSTVRLASTLYTGAHKHTQAHTSIETQKPPRPVGPSSAITSS